MPGKLFIISAPSGAGKTVLVRDIIDRISIYSPIERIITYTSKSARPTEKNAKDYHFVSEDEFKSKIEQNFFMEWSTAYGYYYGSPRSVLGEIARGRSYILIIDRVGAEKVIALYKKAVLIWLYTNGLDVLRERLEKRKTENQEQIEYRLACAWNEIEQELQVPLYKYHILNDDFERAVHKLEKIFCYELTRSLAF